MIANFEFMATTPDAKIWNVENIAFFGDRIELDLYFSEDGSRLGEKCKKKIYYGSKKDEADLYTRENGEWIRVNKK